MIRELAQGFVMMPFRSDPATVEFWRSMRSAAARYEYLAIQRFGSDSLTQGQDLFDAIRTHILNSSFCLADFTLEGPHPNLNVLTEAGLAQGTDTPLYLIGRGDYDGIKGALPSDWHGQYVETFHPRGSERWTEQFADLFEKILCDLDRPLDVATEKPRATDAEQLRWIMAVVDALRSRCRDLYEHPRWGATWSWRGKPLSGLPNSYMFPMTSKEAPGVTVWVGAAFWRWERRGSPFGLHIEWLDAEGQKQEAWHRADVCESLRTCTTEHAVEAMVAHLDDHLLTFTPELDRPTSLSRQIGSFDNAADAIREVCGDHPGLLGSTKHLRWSGDGFQPEFKVEGSAFRVEVGVDFDHWAERGRSPCWIRITPRPGRSATVLHGLRFRKRMRELSESGARLIPVPMGGSFPENLKVCLDEVVETCRRVAPCLEPAVDAEEVAHTSSEGPSSEPPGALENSAVPEQPGSHAGPDGSA